MHNQFETSFEQQGLGKSQLSFLGADWHREFQSVDSLSAGQCVTGLYP